MIYNKDEKAVIFIDGFLNLEYKHKRAILDLYDSPSLIFKNYDIACKYLKESGNERYVNSFKLAINEGFSDKLIEKYEKRKLTVLTEISENYPFGLLDLPINPICLYCKGNLSLINEEKKFSIVGSRKSLNQYLKLTEDFSKILTENGVTIVTGVAVGGDLSAIKGGIDSGKLILVLAGGHDFISSEINRDYINKVVENGGLVISEYPPEVPTLQYHYPIRNRIIAGLSQGTLIVSGSIKSGARHTALFALDYGKEIFTFPYTLGALGGELPNSLIKDGAYLVTELKDITEILGYNLGLNNKIELSSEEKLVITSIKNGNVLVDDIIVDTSLKIYELMPILTALEIKGVLVNVNANEYVVK
ncbi:MAG: DNA-protecting protein DprA [Clostridia bacterium]|nr:DNA-protecting protein DprA [Clostridia bacterium]